MCARRKHGMGPAMGQWTVTERQTRDSTSLAPDAEGGLLGWSYWPTPQGDSHQAVTPRRHPAMRECEQGGAG